MIWTTMIFTILWALLCSGLIVLLVLAYRAKNVTAIRFRLLAEDVGRLWSDEAGAADGTQIKVHDAVVAIRDELDRRDLALMEASDAVDRAVELQASYQREAKAAVTQGALAVEAMQAAERAGSDARCTLARIQAMAGEVPGVGDTSKELGPRTPLDTFWGKVAAPVQICGGTTASFYE